MLRGDLATTPLDEVLRLLADDRATGRLALRESVNGTAARTAEVYVSAGEIYAAWLADPDADPVSAADARLRLRLLAEGTLLPEAWDDAVAAQEELYDWSLGELLVELGHLERAALERVAIEELLDAVAQAYGWKFGSYSFRRRERTRNRAGRSYGVPELLEAITQRRAERDRLDAPAAAVPSFGDAVSGDSDSSGLEAAVLGLVDGVRSVADIELASGCTGLEVATALRCLADRGCVVLPESAPAISVALETGPSLADEQDPVSRWSALLDATLPPPVAEETPRATVERVRSDLPPRPVGNLDPETAQRRARLRARAAEELLAAQAEAEALREAAANRDALGAALSDELSVQEDLVVVEDVAKLEATDTVEPGNEEATPGEVVAAPEPGRVEEAVVDETAVDETAGDETAVDEPILDQAVEQSAVDEPADAVAEPVTDEIVVDSAVDEPAIDVTGVDEAPTDAVAEPTAGEAFEQNVDLVADDPAGDGTADGTPDEHADEHDPALAAVLLRELSSLGLDDEPAPAAARSRAPRVPAPRHAATASRKKRGIFGR